MPRPHGPDRAPLFGDDIAARYDAWAESPAGALARRLQRRLLFSLLDPKWGESVLDVGCGTGDTLQQLADAGVRVTGIDDSPAMLRVARQKLGRVPLLLGDAAALPFADASFDVAIMNTTLEFLPAPLAAVHELTRVARRRVYIGVLNRWSVLGAHRRLSTRWQPSIYSQARFYPFYEIFKLLAQAGVARVRWAGVPYLPTAVSRRRLGQHLASGLSGWPNPFAAYLGFAADIERLETVRTPIDQRLRVVATPEAAIAHAGLGRIAEPPRRVAAGGR